MKIILKAFCQDGGAIFDRLECDDAIFCDYVNEMDYEKGFPKCVKGGYMRFEYEDGKLYTITEYDSFRRLSRKEKEILIDYTQGQWSDGIGEGFEQEIFAGEVNDPFIERFRSEAPLYNPSPWHPGQEVTVSYEGEDPRNEYNTCRICGDHLPEGMGRSNDFLSMNIMPKEIQDKYADTIQQPICYYCEKDNSDEYHKEFERRFVKK